MVPMFTHKIDHFSDWSSVKLIASFRLIKCNGGAYDSTYKFPLLRQSLILDLINNRKIKRDCKYAMGKKNGDVFFSKVGFNFVGIPLPNESQFFFNLTNKK